MLNALSRRQFLKAAVAAGVYVPLNGVSGLAWAAPIPAKPLLVIVFQRGGCDGLSLVAPVSEQGYLDARTPEMRIASSGDHAGLALDTPLVDFRLHPDSAALYALYKDHRLAIVHAAGIVNGTRSHFEAQDLIERGVADNRAMQLANSGWLARVQRQQGDQGDIGAVSATAGLAHMLQGDGHALALPELDRGVGLPGGPAGLGILQALYANGENDVATAGRRTLAALADIDHHLPRGADNKVEAYHSAGHAGYDGNNELGRGLQAIARLARMSVGLNVACVDHGGWDTHDNQPSRFSNQVGQLSRNLGAFHDDLAAAGIPLQVVVMTEFGRRLRSNRSNGTDHGHGGVMMVMGEGVHGGTLYGPWPGLATEQLDLGVDLAVSTDYRQVLAETLQAQGLPMADITAQIFPGMRASVGLGMFERRS